jgi:hypothetical protein
MFRQLTLAFLIVSMTFAGCLDEASEAQAGTALKRVASAARDPTSPEFRPQVVVAVIDTGLNPYHSEYTELYEPADPAEYIPGYPENITTLTLSPWKESAPNMPNRNILDQDVWNQTKPRTLYRIEGTKIVGLISFQDPTEGSVYEASSTLPGSGHGTMTSSRATGNTISAGGPEIRLVLVQGFNAEAIAWAADQDWIDILSISAGITGTNPVQGNVQGQDGMRVMDQASHKKPFFASSGNGLGNAGVLGFPTWLRGASGVPDVISVGANDNGRLSQWHNQQPYIVGDGCQNPSAVDNTAGNITNSGGGTSSATPYSAGTGAKLLLEARRILGDTHVGTRRSTEAIASFSGWDSLSPVDDHIILAQGEPGIVKEGPLADGFFTLQEYKDVLYHTAKWDGSNDPSDGNACPVVGGGTIEPTQLPKDVVVQFNGYGEVNLVTLPQAIAVLKGENKNPARATEDMWYEQFHQNRIGTYFGG